MSNVYVYEQGAVLKYKENRLIINYSENDFKSIPIDNIYNIVIFGAIQDSKCLFIQKIYLMLSLLKNLWE